MSMEVIATICILNVTFQLNPLLIYQSVTDLDKGFTNLILVVVGVVVPFVTKFINNVLKLTGAGKFVANLFVSFILGTVLTLYWYGLDFWQNAGSVAILLGASSAVYNAFKYSTEVFTDKDKRQT